MIMNPLMVVALHIATLVGAIATFGPIFGAIMYVLIVWGISTGDLK